MLFYKFNKYHKDLLSGVINIVLIEQVISNLAYAKGHCNKYFLVLS